MIRNYMLDTNMASYVLKGKSLAARARLETLSDAEAACISAVTEAEMRYGLAKSGGGERLGRMLEWFLSSIVVYPWGREEAAAYGLLHARQEAMGKPLSPFDMQIAAHAFSMGAYLVTNDQAFQHVPDLVGLENWASDL